MALNGRVAFALIAVFWLVGTAYAQRTTPGADFEWYDVAAGFYVDDPGWVTGISAGITARPGSAGSFRAGLATNALIGNAAADIYSPPPGSLWETNVCSTVPPEGVVSSACDQVEQRGPDEPVVELDPSETFTTALNVLLPSEGTYWFYIRFPYDSTSASWSELLDLPGEGTQRASWTASRRGFLTNNPDHLTFGDVVEGAPSLQISFHSIVSPVPEPETYAMFAIGLFMMGSTLVRRRMSRGVAGHRPSTPTLLVALPNLRIASRSRRERGMVQVARATEIVSKVLDRHEAKRE